MDLKITTTKKRTKSPEKRVKSLKIKKVEIKEKVPEETKRSVLKAEKYYEAVGRRKTAVARVRLSANGENNFLINKKPLNQYLPNFELRGIVQAPLDKMNCLDKFQVLAQVKGGGFHSQAEAIRHGIARALVLFNIDFRKKLKKAGFLTRDPRMRERKKFGLKRARRAPQWAKR